VPDLRRGAPDELEASRARILAVPLPPTDPLAGADGPLVALWTP
jgi:uncharacterized protein YjlB